MHDLKKTLLLINPANPYRRGYLLRRESKQVPLGLGIIAALTPKDWRIIIADENFKTFRYRDADLVGITAVTASVNRGYEIASQYRQRGIPVVMGGIHVSALPDEALAFADSVVIGEAEKAWPAVIRDVEAGKLQRIYQSPLADITNLPPARHDLFHPGYLFSSIQTSRGCPMNCDFCSVPWFNGHHYRLRSVDSVLEEIQLADRPMLYFVDDNIIGYSNQAEEHAVAIFEGMIRKNMKRDWFAQASLNIASKPEILKLAARSGCRMLLIGIEAENREALEDFHKKINLKLGTDNYYQAFKSVHKHGINVLGAFIYGMDSDTIQSLQKRTKYIRKSAVDVAQVSVVTPLPGTPLFNKFKEENRMLCHTFPNDWQHFHFSDVVYQPSLMTPNALAASLDAAYKQVTGRCYLRKRFIRTWWNTRSLRSAVWAWNSNLNYRKVALERKSKFTYK